MGKDKIYYTEDNHGVNGDTVVYYAKEINNEYKVCWDKAVNIPSHIGLYMDKRECEKHIQWLNTSQTPTEAPSTPNLAPKTILDDIHQHEVDRLVFWEQYKLATTPIDKEIALLAMLQEDSHIITKLTQYVHNTTK